MPRGLRRAGYLEENQLSTLKADTDVFTTFEGDNTVLLQLVAKGLLTNYRDRFEELGTFGMARYVADQFVGTVVERTAARSLIQRLVDAAPNRTRRTCCSTGAGSCGCSRSASSTCSTG